MCYNMCRDLRESVGLLLVPPDVLSKMTIIHCEYLKLVFGLNLSNILSLYFVRCMVLL